MKSVVNGKEFYGAVRKVCDMLKRGSMKFLNQIRMDFQENLCRLTACNLEAWLMVELPAQGDSFSCVLEDTESMERASRFYEGKVTVDYQVSGDSRRVTFSDGTKRGEFPVQDTELFPQYQEEETRALYVTNAKRLFERFQKVRYAVGNSSQRPEANAICFEGSHLWCLDGSRLASSDDESLTVTNRFLISPESMMSLKALGDTEVQIFVSERYAAFRNGGITLLCRLVDCGPGKKLEDFFGFCIGKTYHLDRKSFLDAVRYLESCVRGKKHPSAIFENGVLYLQSGESQYQASAGAEDCPVLFGFEPVQLRQALEQMGDCPTVKLTTGGGLSAVVLRSGSGDVALLAPVKVNDFRKSQVA